jgi:Ca2+-binding EF-hand superfamily protein
MFHRHDEDGNGKLSEKELVRVLQHLNVACTAQEAAAIVERFDRDGDQTLDIHEFITYIQSNAQASHGE